MKAYIHRVNYYETDKMKLTHHSNYIRFMEEARLDFFEQLGFPYNRFEDEGIISPVVNVGCNYIRTTTFPDVIEITVNVTAITAARLMLAYTMVSNGEIVCTAESTHCFLNEKGKPINFKKRYPEFHKALENQMNNQR